MSVFVLPIRLTNALVLTFWAGALAWLVLAGGSPVVAADRLTLRAPSREYPTIQSAIDASLPGGRVVIPLGEFVESLDVRGKVVDLVGEGADGARSTVLVAPDARRAVITYGPGGGGILRDVLLQGGAVGIRGETGSDPRSDRTIRPAPITVNDVRIRGSVHGVFGSSLGSRSGRLKSMAQHGTGSPSWRWKI